MSAVARTGTAIACTPSAGAAASTERMKNFDCGDVSGLNMTRDAGEPRRDLLEQVEPFAADRELVHAEAGEVAAGLRQARNEALRNRIGDLHEHDRNGASASG